MGSKKSSFLVFSVCFTSTALQSCVILFWKFLVASTILTLLYATGMFSIGSIITGIKSDSACAYKMKITIYFLLALRPFWLFFLQKKLISSAVPKGYFQYIIREGYIQGDALFGIDERSSLNLKIYWTHGSYVFHQSKIIFFLTDLGSDIIRWQKRYYGRCIIKGCI